MFDRANKQKFARILAAVVAAVGATLSATAQDVITLQPRSYAPNNGATVAPFMAGRTAHEATDAGGSRKLAVVATGSVTAPEDDGQIGALESRCIRLAALCRDVANTRIDVAAARSILPSSPNLSPAGIRISRKQVTVHYTFR